MAGDTNTNLYRGILITMSIFFAAETYTESFLNSMQSGIFGKSDSTEFYKKTTELFLKIGKVTNTVPIKQLIPESNAHLFGLTTIAGIWLNEELLDRQPKSVRIFTCAHEAAHYIINHPFKLGLNKCGILALACLPIALLNAVYAYALHTDIVKTIVTSENDKDLDALISPSLIGVLKNGYFMAMANLGLSAIIIKQLVNPLIQKTTKAIEKEADLKAAALMYHHGYAYELEKYIDNLKLYIADNDDTKDDLHPSKLEEYTYLKEYLEEMKATKIAPNKA